MSNEFFKVLIVIKGPTFKLNSDIFSSILPMFSVFLCVYPLPYLFNRHIVFYEEHPTSCSSNQMFIINFHLAWRILFYFLSKKHLNEKIQIRSTKFEIRLSLCRKLCLYNNQMILVYMYGIHLYAYDYFKRCSFSPPSWQKHRKKFSWLVKKRVPFSKNKIFKHVDFFDICAIYDLCQ